MLALFTNMIARLRDEDKGQTMVEYALILFLVSIVSIIILTTLGVNVSNVFQSVSDALA